MIHSMRGYTSVDLMMMVLAAGYLLSRMTKIVHSESSRRRADSNRRE